MVDPIELETAINNMRVIEDERYDSINSERNHGWFAHALRLLLENIK